ncbi:Transposable element Tcb1 transposase [Choanephora cucurbitarum]|uniref:Transposable element Tcb1 transposase n=1 Tax=Choanephora cucurbitarum TaxID=101091 RepID=A0A1C7MZS4_9FUNG|nr:Transposable element Tcb1 transposase [Choanephora cucurbitarum]
MSKYLERKVLQGINTGTFLDAKDAQRYLADNQVVVSSDTVRRLLKRANLEAVHKPDVLLLTPKRKKNRLNWAKSRQNWTINECKRVVFLNETKINRSGSDDAQWAWKAVDEELKDFQLNHLYKHGGGSGYLTKIEGRMDSDLYIEILDDELIKTLDYYGYSEDTVIFQLDNDPKHTAKKTLKHLKDCGIEVMDWPAYSLDLNPIEDLWGLYTPPDSIHELLARVTEVYYDIETTICEKLNESMPDGVPRVIDDNGGQIDY